MSKYDSSQMYAAKEKINDYITLIEEKDHLEKTILAKKDEIQNVKKPLLMRKDKFEKELNEKQNKVVKLENEVSKISQQIVPLEADYLEAKKIIFGCIDELCISAIIEEGGEKTINGRSLMPPLSGFLEETGLHYYETIKYISDKYSLTLHKPIVWYLLYKYRDHESDIQEVGRELDLLSKQDKINFDEAGRYVAEIGKVPYERILPALCKYI